MEILKAKWLGAGLINTTLADSIYKVASFAVNYRHDDSADDTWHCRDAHVCSTQALKYSTRHALCTCYQIFALPKFTHTRKVQYTLRQHTMLQCVVSI